MTIKISNHRLKIIFQNDDFQNDPSMGETIKNVVLQLIFKMLLKNIHNSARLEYSRASLKLEFVLTLFGDAAEDEGRF